MKPLTCRGTHQSSRPHPQRPDPAMAQEKNADNFPSVVPNDWVGKSPPGGGKVPDVSSLHESETGSDRFLVKGSGTSTLRRGLIALAVVLLLLAAVGLALYFTLGKKMEFGRHGENNRGDGKKNLLVGSEAWPDEDDIDEELPAYQVRLTGGLGDSQGRVMVLMEGIWGTVCSKTWTDLEANAICKSLGYESGSAVPSGVHGPGVGVIAMSEVTCPADSQILDDCDYEETEHACAHEHDVAVSCTGMRTDFSPDSFSTTTRGVKLYCTGEDCVAVEKLFAKSQKLRVDCSEAALLAAEKAQATGTISVALSPTDTDTIPINDQIKLGKYGFLRVRVWREGKQAWTKRTLAVKDHSTRRPWYGGFKTMDTYREMCRRIAAFNTALQGDTP